MSGALAADALGSLESFLPSSEALGQGIGDAANVLEDGPEGIAEQIKGKNDGAPGGPNNPSSSSTVDAAKNALGAGVLFASVNKGKILGGILLGLVGLILIITSLDKKVTSVAVKVGKTALETGA